MKCLTFFTKKLTVVGRTASCMSATHVPSSNVPKRANLSSVLQWISFGHVISFWNTEMTYKRVYYNLCWELKPAGLHGINAPEDTEEAGHEWTNNVKRHQQFCDAQGSFKNNSCFGRRLIANTDENCWLGKILANHSQGARGIMKHLARVAPMRSK